MARETITHNGETLVQTPSGLYYPAEHGYHPVCATCGAEAPGYQCAPCQDDDDEASWYH